MAFLKVKKKIWNTMQ